MINLKIVCSSDELKVTQARAKAAESKIIVQRRLSFGQIQQSCLLRGRMMASRGGFYTQLALQECIAKLIGCVFILAPHILPLLI